MRYRRASRSLLRALLPAWQALLVALIFTTPSPTQTFEVASVRPAKDARLEKDDVSNGRFHVAVTLAYLIELAYDISPTQHDAGPPWLRSEVWEVNAKLSNPKPGETDLEEIRAPLRALLADRFQLRMRLQKRRLAHLALVKAGATKLTRSAANQANYQYERAPQRTAQFTATALTMPKFARWIQEMAPTDRPVIDATGLEGAYNFTLRYSAPTPADATEQPGAPEIRTAIQEQLGLKLESRRSPIDYYAIERAERPGEN